MDHYSPDYKSEKPPAVDYLSFRTEIIARCPECGNSDCEHANALAARATEQYRERQRLRDAVVETAVADRKAETRHEGDVGIDRLIASRRAFRAAVTALLEFESKQEPK